MEKKAIPYVWYSRKEKSPMPEEVLLLYGGGEYYEYIIGGVTSEGRWFEEYEGSFIPPPSHWMKIFPPKGGA